MSKQSRIIKDFKIIGGNTKANVLRIELSYRIGGMNYFTGNIIPRGLTLSVQPLEIGDGWKSFTAFSGIILHVKDMKRFSQKTLDTFEPNEDDVKRLVDKVVNQLELKLED